MIEGASSRAGITILRIAPLRRDCAKGLDAF